MNRLDQHVINLSLDMPASVDPTPNVLQVASMFGLGIEHEKTLTLVPPTNLRLEPGRLIFITGASGSGKSTLLRLIRQAIHDNELGHVFDLARLPALPDKPLVDGFPNRSLEQTLRLLSLAGLNDAFVMLRKPDELSDGQRYRLRLAQVMAMVEEDVLPDRLKIILADEFCATLDRITAKVIAHHVRRWVTTTNVCLIVATTHDDLLEPLRPDTLIEKQLGPYIDVIEKPLSV
ncbi:MAG: ATP-binding cassette domain-containing protein [Phycisphaeraceae bacterium]